MIISFGWEKKIAEEKILRLKWNCFIFHGLKLIWLGLYAILTLFQSDVLILSCKRQFPASQSI